MPSLQSIDECLNRFNKKNSALLELMQVMAKHNITFEAEYLPGGKNMRIAVKLDIFDDNEPISIFEKSVKLENNDYNSTTINYVDISRS